MGVMTDRHDGCLHEIGPDGQQKCYLVLPGDKRVDFVRPLRRSYMHEKCGAVTTMNVEIAATYAAQPTFYGATFCVACEGHFPVGPNGEFVWDGTDEKVGS